jgi:hypothetical protein
MKLVLTLSAALVMSGCANYGTHVRTGCIWSCEQHARWEKEADKNKKARSVAEEKLRDLVKAEHEAQIARVKAEHEAEQAQRQSEIVEGKRLDAQCATYSKEDRTLNPSERTAMETAVKDVLKDPWSAQFRNTKKASAWAQCRHGTMYAGEVNAKNSYGGYGGFKNFRVYGKGKVYISSY